MNINWSRFSHVYRHTTKPFLFNLQMNKIAFGFTIEKVVLQAVNYNIVININFNFLLAFYILTIFPAGG